MKVLRIAILVLVSGFATTAGAQSFSVVPTASDPTYGFGSFSRTRVQIPLSAPLGSPADAAALEAVRRGLYAQAQRECAALTNEFKGECRLSSLPIEGLGRPAEGAPRPVSLNGVAVYELRSR